MHDGLHMEFDSGEANTPLGALSSETAADTRTKNVQKALMEYLLLGKINS
jgi:hypothetical protein